MSFFKKRIISTLILLSMFGACSSEKAATNTDSPVSEKQNKEKNISKQSTKTMMDTFKGAGLPVGRIIYHDEKSDPNKKLNRPNQYTQKVSFEVTSIEQPDPEFADANAPFNGGTIEIYTKKEDLENRKRYIEAVTKEMPTLQQYIYVNDLAMLRLEHDVLPNEAKKFNAIFGGK